MSTKTVIVGADPLVVEDLRTRLEDMEGVEVAGTVDTIRGLVDLMERIEVDVAFIEDRLEGSQVVSVQDALIKDPSLAIIFLTKDIGADAFQLAMEAGARALMTHPFAFEELSTKLAAALEWRRRLAPRVTSAADSSASRGRVLTFVGAKGGVGATCLMTHLAWRLQDLGVGGTVCIVDLDLESGDVPSYVDVQYRVSLADLARLGDDITVRAVADTVVAHEHGTHLLLAPRTIRETEILDPPAVRAILRRVREVYDVVLVDVGSAVTPVQAAAVELADDVVQVVTNDVPALRAARRQLAAWGALKVREPQDVKVLVNRYDRRSEIQQMTADKLIQGERLETLVPEVGRGLERSINARTPTMARSKGWVRSLDHLAGELELHSAPRSRGRRRVGREPREAGQGTLEVVGMLPFALLALLLSFQLVYAGIASVWVNHAASEGARAVALGLSADEVSSRAQQAVPAAFRSSLVVQPYAPHEAAVTVRAQAFFATLSSTQELDIGRQPSVVSEP